MNKIYSKFYKQRVFNLSEANKIIKNYQVCKNTLNRLASKKMIKRIRNGIYYIIPLDDEEFYPDTIDIASRIREEGVLAANTALHIHGLWKREDTIYILHNHPAQIRINATTYKILGNNAGFGIEKHEHDTGYTQITIKVTDLERTIIDIIKARSIKIEDVIKALKTKSISLNMKSLLKYLDRYKKPILYNKLGLILEACRDNLELNDDDIKEMNKKLTKKIYYLREKGIKLIKPRYKYYKNWNAMISEHLYEAIKETSNQAKPI